MVQKKKRTQKTIKRITQKAAGGSSPTYEDYGIARKNLKTGRWEYLHI